MTNILLAYNAVALNQRHGMYADCATFGTIKSIYRALLEGGNVIYPVNCRSEVQVGRFLNQIPPMDLAMVLAEGFLDEPRTMYDGSGGARVRECLQGYGIRCTHTGVTGMELCRKKDRTYKALQAAGIRIPAYQCLPPVDTIPDLVAAIDLPFPLFVKPEGGGDSMGIDDHSIVADRQQLHQKISAVYAELGPSSLIIEQFLPGQEYTVGVLGNQLLSVLPVLAFPRAQIIRSQEVKRWEHTYRECFQVLEHPDGLYPVLAEIATRTFEAVGASDVLRIDMREDHEGGIYIIDVNGTPSLGKNASLAYVVSFLGITHSELVNLVLYESMLRHGLMAPLKMNEMVSGPLAQLAMYRQLVA